MASVGYKEKDWNVPRHTGAMIKLGLKVELFDIDEQNPLLLEQYDVIFVMGGNPFYLLSQMRAVGCKELFAEYIKSKIVIDRFLERIDNFEKCNNIQITRINDGQAVFVNKNNTVIV